MVDAAPAGRSTAPAFALLFNAFVWGVSWWPFRYLHDLGLHPLWATTVVYLFSLACLLSFRPSALRLAWRHPALCWLALSAGLTNVGFNWAVTVGDVVRVVLLFYLMPAWSVLLAWLMLDERPTPASLLRLVLALTGVVIVLDSGASGLPLPRSLPDWLALLGGFTFALTNILLRRLQAAPAETRVLAMFAGGTVMATGTALLGMTQGVATPPVLASSAVLPVLGLALAFLLGNIALQYGASRLAAHTTALVMLSEVVFASVTSVWLGASDTSARTWAGGALILVAAAWSAWPTRSADVARSPQAISH